MSEPAFLRAILADPSDDGPRLVYADWLDERGQAARAEFIRVQCELAKGCDKCHGARWRAIRAQYDPGGADFGNDGYIEPCDCNPDPKAVFWDETKPSLAALEAAKERRAALRRRERELLTAGGYPNTVAEPCNEYRWLAEVVPDLSFWHGINWVFRRGFVASAALTLAAFAGGPCENCDGFGEFTRENSDGPRGPCPDCGGKWNSGPHDELDGMWDKGTGRTPGLAPQLFGAAPITEVRLTDRVPLTEGGNSYWHGEIQGGRTNTSNLPTPLFALLLDIAGQKRFGEVIVWDGSGHQWRHADRGQYGGIRYPTPEAAHAALGDTCVVYGRSVAKDCWHEAPCPVCSHWSDGTRDRNGVVGIRCHTCPNIGRVTRPGLPPLKSTTAR
jgi:uncharacterized protein (TIGR02996 family)